MKNFSYLLSCIFFCFLSSCGDRKTDEQQVTTIPAGKESVSEKTVNKAPDTLKHDSLASEVADAEHEKADSAVVADSLADNSTDSLVVTAEDSLFNSKENPEELERMKHETFASVLPELSEKIAVDKLPTTAEVGIKPYPNSFIIKMNNKMKYKDKFYATMELASPDTPDQVLEFYRQWKDTWFYIENSAVHTFKKDEEKYFRETNTLQILPFDKAMHTEIDSLLSFDAKSLIRIYYEIPKQ